MMCGYISKIESGRMTLDPVPFSLRESVDEMVAIVRQTAAENQLGFTVQIHDVTQDIIVADPLRLRQILLNLLANAVKYTEPGGHVRFAVSEKAVPGCTDRTRLQFIITDDGIGMSEEFQKTMYTSFSRATDSRINKIQGSGLGLAIARQMTELMGGEIQCESALGRGTTFRVVFELPIVAMTADAFAEDVAACREAGMDAHIAKPVDIKQVLRTLKLARDGTLHEQKKS